MNLKTKKQKQNNIITNIAIDWKKKLPQSITVVGCPEKITNETSIF
jgi:hypothetical protein